jgi:hypothetical protein
MCHSDFEQNEKTEMQALAIYLRSAAYHLQEEDPLSEEAGTLNFWAGRLRDKFDLA